MMVSCIYSFGRHEGRVSARNHPQRNQKSARGSAAPAVLFALLIIILVAFSAYSFSARAFRAPAPITTPGAALDHQYNLTLYVTGIVFILVQLALAIAIFRFRDRGQRARFSRGNNAAEIIWTSVTIVVFIVLAFLGRKVWAESRLASPTANAIRIEVTTSQFVYNFRYPGADGKFGRIDPSQISAATGNPLGLDASDPAGKDDIVAPELTVPVDRPVELLIRSQDVVHNFFVRELRLQQDAVPGLTIPLQFTANRTGRYEIVCTQLCGLGHSRMRSFLNVVPEAGYEQFLKQQAAAQ